MTTHKLFGKQDCQVNCKILFYYFFQVCNSGSYSSVCTTKESRKTWITVRLCKIAVFYSYFELNILHFFSLGLKTAVSKWPDFVFHNIWLYVLGFLLKFKSFWGMITTQLQYVSRFPKAYSKSLQLNRPWSLNCLNYHLNHCLNHLSSMRVLHTRRSNGLWTRREYLQLSLFQCVLRTYIF